jgi:ubiquinone/menaquinone biosynthesis C-methylase UbiE
MSNINTEEYWDKKHDKTRNRHITDVKNHFEAIRKFIPENSKVLEIGAGLGDLCYLVYHNISKNLYAADISSVSLGIIKEKIPDIKTIKTPFEPAEIEEKDFDVIIISHVLEHIENPDKHLDKWKKSLKPDGTIIVAVPLNDKPYIEHLRIYTLDSLEEFIRKIGYRYTILTRKRPKGEEGIAIMSNKEGGVSVNISKGITGSKNYLPNEVYIEVTNHCQANCPMCPRKTMKRPLGFMPWKLFEEITEKLVQIEGKGLTVFLHYMGEPLMDLTIPDKVKILKDKLPNSTIAISTNGALLNPIISKEIVESGLDVMTISIDAGKQSTYAKLRGFKLQETKDKIERLLKLKKEANSKLKIIVQFIKSEVNKEEEDLFLEYWSKRDVVPIIKPQHSFFTGKSYLTKKKSETQLFPCMQPFMYLIIYWNGDLGLCCWDSDRYVPELGNIKDGTIEKLFNSKKYKEIRKKMLKGQMNDFFPCKDCLQIFGNDMNLDIYNKRVRIKK